MPAEQQRHTPGQQAAMEAAFRKWGNSAYPPGILHEAAFHFGGGYAAATDAHAPLLAAAQGLMALVEIADSGQSVLPYDKELDIWDAAIGRLEDAVSSVLGEAAS